ncbi:MAG: hypothetical protein CMJ65_17140 [Planctomycetaceae bacterium]|jgi:hypothetical protein|nr:hypothetical protein [Planctomycetaceae bacterium]MDP7276389.1 hypothetical protein [Planctomycetaceae bacterium]
MSEATQGVSRWQCSKCNAEWVAAAEEPMAGDGKNGPAGKMVDSLGQYLFFGLSLPERAVRSAVGLAAGTAKETAEFLVPQAFQDSRTYGIVVRNSLRFLTEEIGGVESSDDSEPPVEGYLARKAVGNFVDLAGWASLSCSPVWLLAVVSDVAYGTKSYVRELADELQEKGLIDEDSTINGIDDLLAAIQGATGETAGMFDTPPLSIDDLKATLTATRQSLESADISQIVPESEMAKYWEEMKGISAAEDVSLLGVSGALTMLTMQKVSTVGQGALTGLQVAGGLVNRHMVGHYFDSLKTVKEQGIYKTLRDTSEPYIDAVWTNFSVEQETWTEELLSGRAISRGLSTIAGWFRESETPPDKHDT